MYKELAENEEHREYYYFRRFKMALNKEVILIRLHIFILTIFKNRFHS